VLNDTLEKFKGMIELLDVGARHASPLRGLTNHMPGIASWEGRKFHPSVRNSVRILPSEAMEGFFIAKIRKNKELS
jgi:hypothetical protein